MKKYIVFKQNLKKEVTKNAPLHFARASATNGIHLVITQMES